MHEITGFGLAPMRYFTCKKNYGLFLTLDKMKQPPSDEATSVDLQDRVSQLERELRQKTQQLFRSEKRQRILQEEVREKEGRVAILQGEVREKEGRVAILQGEVREKEDRVALLQGEVREKEDRVAILQGEVREKEGRVAILQGEVKEKEGRVAILQGEVREKEGRVAILQGEVKEKVAILQGEVREREAALSGLRDQLTGQNERHVTELRQVRQEAEQNLQQFREEQVQRQQLMACMEAAMALMRGEAVSPQALELWELPREEVHISQTILGTGGWGYVARGTFRGQTVAVKCLHRGILSPQNEGRVRREISIMSQVRHPNLLLLIGAVLTVEGAGPLIVTELLDRSLRSAYEGGMLEERSKVPVLRDVASALIYLHSHHHTPIIHRDVSSANVLLEAIRDRKWKAKLSDFGSANLSHLATTPAEGAAVYSAPEVSTDNRSRQTVKIDVYSFGVLMCEVCLCRFPPEKRHFPSMLSDVRRTAPNMFPLARDCTSHAYQDRPGMREVLQRIDQLTEN